MTKKNAIILSLVVAAGLQACRSGKAPLRAADAVEGKLEPAADAQDSMELEEEVESIPSIHAPDGESVEAASPVDEAKTFGKGKKKKDTQKGKCKYVQCFDLCCDKGQVCAHTHGSGGDGPFPASYKCITPPK